MLRGVEMGLSTIIHYTEVSLALLYMYVCVYVWRTLVTCSSPIDLSTLVRVQLYIKLKKTVIAPQVIRSMGTSEYDNEDRVEFAAEL